MNDMPIKSITININLYRKSNTGITKKEKIIEKIILKKA